MLRDYQMEQVRVVCDAARKGHRRIVISSATGTGKTEAKAALFAKARYPLAVVPRVDLMRQTADRFRLRLGEPVDIEQGANRVETLEGLRSRVCVASRDSLLSNDRYRGKAFERITLVAVDECHIGMTDRMIAMLSYFEERGATIVGWSATPYKGRGKALRYWPRPSYSYGLLEAIRDGWLVPPRCFISRSTSLDLSLITDVAGEWSAEQLGAVLASEHFAQELSSLVLSTYRQQPSVVYVASVRQARLLAEVFERYGCPVSVVHSHQNLVERASNMRQFMSGDTRIIVNVGVLGFGWDCPELRNIYMGSPLRSLSGYEQRMGRGTRPLAGVLSPGMTREERLAAIAGSLKPHFSIYDVTDSSGSTQILDALAVLDAKSRANPARRARQQEQALDGGVDALEAIAHADEWEREKAQAEAEQAKERRRRLLVGVTFGHETRDLFSPPVGKRERGWRMLFGPHAGTLLRDLPTGYLAWVVRTQRKPTPFRAAVERELSARSHR